MVMGLMTGLGSFFFRQSWREDLWVWGFFSNVIRNALKQGTDEAVTEVTSYTVPSEIRVSPYRNGVCAVLEFCAPRVLESTGLIAASRNA